MNAYADLTAFKDKLGISGTAADMSDAEGLRLLEAASRTIEGICRRRFYVETRTRYFDGNGRIELWLPTYELLSITSLTVDDAIDYDYDVTLVEGTDFWLYPDNETYKWRLDIHPNSALLSWWPPYRRALKIAGKWGYKDDSYDSGNNVGTGGIDASATTLPVSATTDFAAGQTILVEAEQMYVTAIGTLQLTVERGVNGTTAAAHLATKDIYIYRYPDVVKSACLFAAHAAKLSEASPVTQVIASPEMGTLTIPRSVKRQLEAILDQAGLIKPGGFA